MAKRFVLTMSCPDRAGLVAKTAGFIAEHGGFVTEAAFASDPTTQRFFGRLVFHPAGGAVADFAESFHPFAKELNMDFDMDDLDRRPKVMILVSKLEHCLNDLLYRYRTGDLRMEVTAVVSNHPDFRPLAEWHGLRFEHLPITRETKMEQEQALWRLVTETETELLVLARYMQVLSPGLSAKLVGRAINIHHSFLPSFKGARPYHQAFDRGVKLIGATAHYVTDDLDEGPIIEQETQRVDHLRTPEEYVAVGRDTEALVLARAVRYHLERRVLLNGNKTIVFR